MGNGNEPSGKKGSSTLLSQDGELISYGFDRPDEAGKDLMIQFVFVGIVDPSLSLLFEGRADEQSLRMCLHFVATFRAQET